MTDLDPYLIAAGLYDLDELPTIKMLPALPEQTNHSWTN